MLKLALNHGQNKEEDPVNSIKLLLDGDLTTTTSSDRITAVLEANNDVKTINLVDCSAQQFLDFILEVQKYAIDQHVANSVDEEEEL